MTPRRRARAEPGPAAGEQVARILTLVPFLHARGQVNVEDAARLLGVTPDQVVSDLKVLFMCGLPGGYPDDLIDVDIDALEGEGADGVIRVANADYLARPLRLTPTEASAMIVAVRALRAGAGEQTRAIVDRVLAKLEAAAASGPGAVQVEPGTDADTDQALLAGRLQSAVDAGRQVRLRYWVPARDEVSDRVVDPRGIATRQGQSYLDAYCHGAQAPRLFRLDRIADAEVLDTASSTPHEDPRDLSEGVLLEPSDDTSRVTLRLSPEARWITEYYQVEDVRPAAGGPPGSLDGEIAVADERWLTRLLLRVVPHAQVIGPERYSTALALAADAALALYTPEPGAVTTTEDVRAVGDQTAAPPPRHP